jgi:hypothetical protein
MATFNPGQILTAAELEAIIDPPYGQITMSSATQNASTAAQLAPMTAGILNGFTVVSNNLVVPSNGIYAVSFDVASEAFNATAAWEGILYKNGSPLFGSYGWFSAAGQFLTVSGYVLASLVAGDTLGLWASSASGAVIVQQTGTVLNAVRVASV